MEYTNQHSSVSRVLIEPHYLPTLEFFSAISNFDEIVLDVHSHYVKQSFRNRTMVNSANGPQTLIIPVTKKTNRTPLFQVECDENYRWRLNHWRTIESAYRKAPFFEFYADDIHQILSQKDRQLSSLNINLLSICLKWLGWTKNIILTTEYLQIFDGTDLRDQIHAKIPCFSRAFFKPRIYKQVFGSSFVANLSVLDLIFCTGPHAPDWLMRSEPEG